MALRGQAPTEGFAEAGQTSVVGQDLSGQDQYRRA